VYYVVLIMKEVCSSQWAHSNNGLTKRILQHESWRQQTLASMVQDLRFVNLNINIFNPLNFFILS